PAARGRDQYLDPRCNRRGAKSDRRGHRRGGGGGAAVLPQPHPHRPPDAGDRTEHQRRAHPRHSGRAHDPARLRDQRVARRARLRAGDADLSRQILQRRISRHGRLHRGDRRRLQPGARRDRRRAAARRDRQFRRRLSLGAVPRRDPARAAGPRHYFPPAGAGRPRRGAQGMTVRHIVGAAVLALIVVLLIVAPLGLKPYGIYILTLWAVTTIAAIGLNLTLGYAGQVSLAQGAFVGIGAYVAALLTTKGWPLGAAYLIAGVSCFGIGWLLGYPALRVQHHYLPFLPLA